MGCRFGWMLHRAGVDVVLLDGWREHVEAINDGGLTIVDRDGAHVVRLPARPLSDSGSEHVDVVLVFGKAMQTPEIMATCREALAPQTWVMTLQNGLGNIEVIERFVPRRRILAGTTTFSAELLAPGRVRAIGTGTTELMSLDADASGFSEIVDVMSRAGLNVRVSGDVMATIWMKVAFNSVLNALCALLRVPVGALPTYADLAEVVAPIVDEVVAVAGAEGVILDRGVILRKIEQQYDPAAASDHLPSMLLDILQGREIEVEHLNGAVVRIADRDGIAVPYNSLIRHLLLMSQATRQARVEGVAI
jgi:2-dehydropantoate 2-reductase